MGGRRGDPGCFYLRHSCSQIFGPVYSCRDASVSEWDLRKARINQRKLGQDSQMPCIVFDDRYSPCSAGRSGFVAGEQFAGIRTNARMMDDVHLDAARWLHGPGRQHERPEFGEGQRPDLGRLVIATGKGTNTNYEHNSCASSLTESPK